MTWQNSLTNQFLIAMPAMEDPNFTQTVTYICEHNEQGALGIVINRPMSEIHLGDLLEQLDVSPKQPDVAKRPIFAGGPVQPEHGFILHRPARSWESTLQIDAQIGLTTSQDILTAIADGEGPGEALIALGYAGWGAGQLEQELADNAWLSVPVNYEVLFHVPAEQRWQQAAALLGVDLSLMSSDAGHA
jgi:putative transcriptional regulator